MTGRRRDGRFSSFAALVAILALAACAGRPPRVVPARPPAPVASTAAASPPRRPPVVPAPRRRVVHTYFGTSVTDDYEWLEDGTSPEVRSFVAAQDALTRATLDALPERAAVRERVTAILSAPSADWTGVRSEGGRLFALEDAPPKQQRVLVDLGPFEPGRPVDPARARAVVDPGALDRGGRTTIDFFVPSPDAKLVAVSLSKDGTESGDVHVFEVATGKDRGETIARVNGGTAGGSVAWNADGSGFYYTRYPRAGERPATELDFHQEVWFHKLGTAEAADVPAIGKDFPRVAETELVRSDDGKRILAHVANGDGGEVEHHVLDEGRWVRLSRFEDELGGATFGPDGRVYAVSRKGAPRGKVVAFAPPFDRSPPVDVVPQGDGVIESLAVTRSALYLVETVDGPSRVRRFPLGAKAEPLAREPRTVKPARKGAAPPPPPAPPPTIAAGARGPALAVLPLPALASVTGLARAGDDLLLRLESYTEAPRWVLYRAAEHRVVATGLARNKTSWDMSDVDVTRETCVSKDGTRVPMSVLRRRGAAGGAPLPAYLTGYGGFGVTVRPRLRPLFRGWLDLAGGVVAEANLRGGGERGEAWHRAGKLTSKQNVVDDFAACAGTLFDRGLAVPERLAIGGRSNGGLLMGAALVQHPEMFRAVVAAVGIHDLLRTELSPNGAFNVSEYGSVKDEAQFRALRALSPLHNVKDDVAYPAVLFTTGANDPRVDPYHSRKMVARLQAATSSERPILLRAGEGGHGAGAPLSAEIEEMTDVLTFLVHEVTTP